MATVDVTVLGGGIFGLAVAYACARRGARVRVIERARIGSGASGGVVGALAPHTPDIWDEKKAFQFESLIMAEAYWRGVREHSGIDPGYARCGRLQPLASERAVGFARARAISAARLWQGLAEWRVVDAAGFAPWAPRSPTGLLIHDTLSARLHPLNACTALAGAVTSLGGEIVLGEAPVRGAVVEATGWRGLQTLSKELGLSVGNGVKGQAMLLDHDARARPLLTAVGLFIVPHGDGTTGVGSTSEREFAAPDTTDAALDALHARAVAALPVLAGARVLKRWAGVRPRARSLAPMLGAHPSRPGVFIANGAFKIGFAVAPKVGEMMADLVLDGHDAIPPLFRLSASV